MIEIPLQAIPNQSLTIRLGDQLYILTLKEAKGVMGITIERNNEVVLSNARMVNGTPLIPYRYKEDGNFLLLTANDDYPYYDKFGITQNLIYATQTELEAIRAT